MNIIVILFLCLAIAGCVYFLLLKNKDGATQKNGKTNILSFLSNTFEGKGKNGQNKGKNKGKGKEKEPLRRIEGLQKPTEVPKVLLTPQNQGAHDGNKTSTLSSPQRGRASVILLVEDSPTMLLALRKILERWHYKVVTAENGRQAWGHLQKMKPDLVISDIDMPQLNGLELVNLMRSDIVFMNIPVILITGNASFHLQASQQAGVNGLLAKPFEDRALIDQVRYILQE